MKWVLMPLVAALLAACADVPELEGTIPPHLEEAKFPRLVPVEPLLAEAENTQITPETEEDIAARVARLKARAARLRNTTIDGGA